MVSPDVPEEVARRVWARWATGTHPRDIAAWLDRVGYSVSADEVVVIAVRYEQARDATPTIGVPKPPETPEGGGR